MKHTIKTTLAVIGAAAMFSTAGALLPSAEGYTAAADTSIILEAAKAPSAPSIKSYESTANSVALKWGAVKGASGYRVYRKSGGKWVKVKTLYSGASCTDKNLQPYTAYEYKVKAFTKTSRGTVWGKSCAAYMTTTRPETIKFKPCSATEDAIRLNWYKVKCDGYQVFMKQNGVYKKIATIRNSGTTTYKVKGLADGTKYGFKIRAYGRKSENNDILYGNCGKKNKSTATVEMPNAIGMRLSAKVNGTSCVLDWSKVDCDGYEIYMSGAGEGITERIPNVAFKKAIDIDDCNVTTATVSNLCSGSDYVFTILCYNEKKNGEKVYCGGLEYLSSGTTREITTDFDYDEVNSKIPTWETENVDVTVKVNYEESFKCLELINAERKKNGEAALIMDENLLDMAITRVAEDYYVFSPNHVRPNGLMCYSIGEGSENGCAASGVGATLSEAAFELWDSHLPHKENFLGNWTSTGLAIAEVKDCYGTYFMAVQVFDSSNAKKPVYSAKKKTETITRTIEAKKYIWSY